MVITNLSAWLKRTAVNTALNARRRHKTHQTLPLDPEATTSSPPNPQPAPATADLLDTITKILENLPEKHKAAFTLRFLEEKSYDEIADALRCSPEAARKNAERARDRVRQAIQALEGPS